MASGSHDTLVQRLAMMLVKLNQGESLDPRALAQEFGVNVRTIQRDINERFGYLPLEKIDGTYRMTVAVEGSSPFDSFSLRVRAAAVVHQPEQTQQRRPGAAPVGHGVLVLHALLAQPIGQGALLLDLGADVIEGVVAFGGQFQKDRLVTEPLHKHVGRDFEACVGDHRGSP